MLDLNLIGRAVVPVCFAAAVFASVSCDEKDSSECDARTTRAACEPASEADSQDRCYWLDIDVRRTGCDVVEQRGVCVSIPWVGDASTLLGSCGDESADGVAYRENDGGYDAVRRTLYGADLSLVDDWQICRYDGNDPQVCACYCD